MDRYLFEMIVTKLEDETYSNTALYFAKETQQKITIGDKVFLNYYPNDGYSLQFVVEAEKKGKRLNVGDIDIHHNSPDVWNLRIGAKTRAENTFLVTTKENDYATVIRFVNYNDDKNHYKEGDIVKAQVVGFVINGNIYESEEAYKKATKNQKYTIADNTMLPLKVIINNLAKKPKKEKESIPAEDDRIVAANFKVKSCHKNPLHIFGQDFPAYYAMEVETEYGNMHLFFATSALEKPIEQFKKGDIFVGEIMLSGNVYFKNSK